MANSADRELIEDVANDSPAPGVPPAGTDSRWSLKTFATGQDLLQQTRRIRDWVRTRYSLTGDDTCMVTEVVCELPGCPPLETVIAFWTENGEKRHHYKIFKPAAEVIEDDLPPYWMKNALAVDSDFYCSCC